MQFSTIAITFYFASLAGSVSGFTVPSTAFVNTRVGSSAVTKSATELSFQSSSSVHAPGCACPQCMSFSNTCNCPSCTGFHPANCNCPSCVGGFSATFQPAACPTGCACPSCSSTSLHMSSTEEPTPEEPAPEVPVEVAAMDGVNSEEEAHNAERPARASGTAKHKKDGAKGTPLSELVVGSSVEGKVKTLTSYGAFVDIGAATDALLHVSRLSVDFVSNVEDVVKAGQEVTVRIVTVDAEKGQVALTMLTEAEEEAAKGQRGGGAEDGGKRKQRPQRSQGDRRSQVVTMNSVNDAGHDTDKFIEGEVVSMLDFGAFVRFDASQLVESVSGELDGLVHISALKAERVDSVASVVSVGEKVQIRVKGIDAEGGKVALSMITDEQEQANRPQRGGGGGGGKRGRSMFSESEMGAKDWKESLDKFQTDQGTTFTNAPLVQPARK